MSGPSQEQLRSLLDFSQPFDSEGRVELLQAAITIQMSSTHPLRAVADEILVEFSKHEDAWIAAPTIVRGSQDVSTKVYGLFLLATVIKKRWKALAKEQREGIKNFILGMVLEQGSSEVGGPFGNKLHETLVEILKEEWPANWPTFISEICDFSKKHETVCQNNLHILQFMSEEVFNFSAGQMISQKAARLKDQMCSEFNEVFQLCNFVFENSQNYALVLQTLKTFQCFLQWIPLGFIFETTIMKNLINKFLPMPYFRNQTLKCLTEVGALPLSNNKEYHSEFMIIFQMTIARVKEFIPLRLESDPDSFIPKGIIEMVGKALDQTHSPETEFIRLLAIFLKDSLKNHHKQMEQCSDAVVHDALLDGLKYLIIISHVGDREIFKICLEFWYILADSVYDERTFHTANNPFQGGSSFGRQGPPRMSSRMRLYQPIVHELRLVLIERMEKPEEVLITNVDGEIRRVVGNMNTEHIHVYTQMKMILVLLTNVDASDTKLIMDAKLSEQVALKENFNYRTWHSLNTLCWAIGAISGTMETFDEKKFLVDVIRSLLSLTENTKGKENKAVVASNIMFVVGQYPRFLRQHGQFLKTVVKKLFEFMHEPFEGVQDMACDTFIKISKSCKKIFIHRQNPSEEPFLVQILKDLDNHTRELQPSQIQTFFKAVGYQVSAADQSSKVRYTAELMKLPNMRWGEIMVAAATNPEILMDEERLDMLTNILKTNTAACDSIGHTFIDQIAVIRNDLRTLYLHLSQVINQAKASANNQVKGLNSMIKVRREVCVLLKKWLTKANTGLASSQMITQDFMPSMVLPIVRDYAEGSPHGREAEVLATLAVVFARKLASPELVLPVLELVFEPTWDMVKQGAEYPDHRIAFYELLMAINENHWETLFQMPEVSFDLFSEAVIFACKHDFSPVATAGLKILRQLIKNVNTLGQGSKNGTEVISAEDQVKIQGQFYKKYFMTFFEYVLAVLCDLTHKLEFKQQAEILQFMMSQVDSGQVTVPIYNLQDPALQGQQPSNKEYLFGYTKALLAKVFPHLQQSQIDATVQGLFAFDKDIVKFKEHLRNFLVEIRQHAGEGTSSLYLEERQREMELAEARKAQVLHTNVPDNDSE